MDGFYPNAPPPVYPANDSNSNYPGHPSTQIGFVFDGGAGANNGPPSVTSFPSQNRTPYPSPGMSVPMPMPSATTYAPAPYYSSDPQQNMTHQSGPVVPYPSGNFGYPDNQNNYNYNNTRDLQVRDEFKQPPAEYYPNNDYNAHEQYGPNHGQKGGGIPGGKLGVVGGAAVAGLGTALATNLLLPKKLKKNKLVKYGLPIAGAGAGGYYLNKLNNKPK